jgi:[ribosomal protein S18]-alanine N-acetyltransferase
MMESATVALRAMTLEDVDLAVGLETRVYRQAWSQQVFLDELAQESRRYIVAEIGSALAGYGGVMLVENEAHITTVVVDPDHRQARIGTRLMLALVDVALASAATALTLEVRVSNEAAQALYRRFGMAPVGVRKQYYRDEDALIMWVHDIDSDAYRRRLEDVRETVR